MAALGARHHAQVLLLGQLAGGNDLADARAVHGHRLLHEDVLACLHGRLDVEGAETRRSGQDGIVHAFDRQGLLVGVPAKETGLGRHLLPQGLHVGASLGDGILENVGQGDNLHVGAGGVEHRSRIQDVLGRALAPSAASNQRDADGVVRGRLAGQDKGEVDRGRAGDHETGMAEKPAPR